MGDFLAHLVIFFILFSVAGVVGVIIRHIRNRGDIRGLPQPEERYQLLDELRRRRQEGASHAECIQYLRSQGLRKGVAEGMIIDVEREQSPDLTSPKTLQWHQCSCQYPGNWSVKALDEAAGIDAGVTLESIGSAILILIREDDSSGLESLREEYTSQLRDHTTTSLAFWGDIPGAGEHLTGVHKKLKLPVEITVFKPDTSSMPFLLVDYWADEEADIVAPAFDLIRSTFEIGRQE